jgi:hypothetical protein
VASDWPFGCVQGRTPRRNGENDHPQEECADADPLADAQYESRLLHGSPIHPIDTRIHLSRADAHEVWMAQKV